MTLRTFSVKNGFTTDAEFRTYAQAIHDALAAAGLVQTADTGQINLTTVLKPASLGTSQGYEVWRFADTLQATAPIYFKIEYGSGAGNVGQPGLWVTVGSGSDGAGTITGTAFPGGTVFARKQPSAFSGGGSSTSTLPCYCQYLSDGAGIALLMFPAETSNLGGFFFAIERTRSSDGTANGDGVTVWTAFDSTSAVAQQDARHYVSSPQPTGGANWAAPGVPGSINPATVLAGTTLYPLPVFTGAWGRPGSPSQLLLAVGRTDMGVAATFTLPHYGTTRTWLCAGPGATTPATGWGPTSGGTQPLASFAIRGD